MTDDFKSRRTLLKTNKIAVALIAINIILLVLLFSPLRAAFAQPSLESVPAVLRAHSLEIVDDRGRVRAQIILTQPSTVDGVYYPEGTLLRVNDAEGHPNVKIGSDSRGAGVAFSGGDPARNTWYGVQVLSQDGQSTIRVVDKDGKETVIKPGA
jgi:hypothetical protein